MPTCRFRKPILILCLVFSFVAAPVARADQRRDSFIAGTSLVAAGGVGVVVGSIGSFALMVHSEYTGFWGWLSLLSGGATFAGGILMAHTEVNAQAGGTVAIALGTFSVVTGIVGLALQAPEANRRQAVLLPMLVADPRGEAVPMLGVHGVF